MAFPTDQNYHSFPFYFLHIFLYYSMKISHKRTQMLTKLALISLGGGIGAALRFYVGYVLYLFCQVICIIASQRLLHQYVSVFWHRAMCGDDKRARFTLICISYYRFAWGIQHILYLQPRSAKTPAKSLYPYRNALYATLQCMWNPMCVSRLCV